MDKTVKGDDQTQSASLSQTEFKNALIEVSPHLRAFARSLSGNSDVADDLVQDTLLKAWAARDRFQAGTSMRSWTFVILRNTYFSNVRRKKFTGDYDETAAERILSTAPTQEDPLNLADLQRALMELSENQREAIILVGAGGFAYEDAAQIAGCALGTMKSRVSRARKELQELLAEDDSSSSNGMQDRPESEARDKIVDARHGLVR